MRILITGASGYIGARFVRYMTKMHPNAELFLASRSGQCPWLNGFGTQVSMDLNVFESINLPKNLDTVIHLAAINEIECADVRKALQSNVVATWNLIQSSVMQPLKKFVYASTIHVYGDLVGLLDEVSPTRAKHPYGFTHQMSEQLFEYAFTKYKVPTTCLRFSNVFGAPADLNVNRWSLLVNDLCRQAVEKRKLILKSPGSQRDFMAMPDACTALDQAIFHADAEPGFKIFNVSSAKNMSVLQMAELIATRAFRLLGEKIEITVDQNEVPVSGVDFQISNTKAKLWGWEPKSDFGSEIDATLNLCAGAQRE